MTFRAAVVLLPLSLFAQPPAFEVASVKVNHSGSTSSHSDSDNNLFRFVNLTMKRLISRAYDVREDQIVGPEWIGTERYDITAKAEGVPSNEQSMQMMQTLLADRFKLALHRETRESRAYALVVAKGGLKISKVEDSGQHSTNSNRGSLKAEGITMRNLANTLSRIVGAGVVDETGVEGVFDLQVEWDPAATALSPDAPADSSATGPSLFTALQEKLGLKLDWRKTPVEFLVIDHVERVPTEN